PARWPSASVSRGFLRSWSAWRGSRSVSGQHPPLRRAAQRSYISPMQNQFPEPLSGTVVPRFAEVATFMRLPIERDPKKLDIALVGVPWDGGTTFRPGARHGPREMRNMSTLMRRVHHATGVSPYELCRVADHGDAPVNPIDLADSLKRIEGFYARLHRAGAAPLTAGGDHLVTLPILRAIGRSGSFISTPIPIPRTPISAASATPTARRSAAPSRKG